MIDTFNHLFGTFTAEWLYYTKQYLPYEFGLFAMLFTVINLLTDDAEYVTPLKALICIVAKTLFQAICATIVFTILVIVCIWLIIPSVLISTIVILVLVFKEEY